MKRTTVLVLVLVFGIALLAIGCGGGKNGLATGKYQMTSMVSGGEDALAFAKEMGVSLDGFYLEVLDGGKCKLCIGDPDDILETSYTLDGKNITMGGDYKGTVDGKKITLGVEDDGVGVTMTFEKK